MFCFTISKCYYVYSLPLEDDVICVTMNGTKLGDQGKVNNRQLVWDKKGTGLQTLYECMNIKLRYDLN